MVAAIATGQRLQGRRSALRCTAVVTSAQLTKPVFCTSATINRALDHIVVRSHSLAVLIAG